MNKESLLKTIDLQNTASDPKNSAWVFASAGSGKTKILVDRVLRFLLEKVAANKILCVTFTKIAAIEMQERVSKILANWVVLDDEKLSDEIFKLTDKKPTKEDLQFGRTLFAKTLDEDFEIKIQTIHSFCQSLVKVFPFEMGVSPNFELLDDGQERILLEKAKREVFFEARNDENLQKIITEISSRLNEDAFSDLLLGILSKKEKLIDLKAKFFDINNVIAKIFDNLGVLDFENEEQILQKFLSDFDLEKVKIFGAEITKSEKKTNQKNGNLLLQFTKNPNVENTSFLREVFYNKNGEKTAKIVTKEYDEWLDFIELMRLRIAEFFDDLNSFKIAEATSFLLEFSDLILQKYSEIKAQNSVLDYNDLIIKTNELLANTDYSDWVKFRMDGFFDHVLIDESQDTNHQQWAIIKVLCEDFFGTNSSKNCNRSLFIIGDDKQSIYGFQGALAGISHEIFDFYDEKTKSLGDEIKKVELQNSFRSLPKILKFVDGVFEQNKSFESLEYKSHKAIRQGEGRVEIWPRIESQEKQKKTDYKWQNYASDENFLDEEFCQKQEMATRIAQNILRWIDDKKQIQALDNKEQMRDVKFGDIMILLRNRANGFDKILQKTFEENSIPFKGVKKTRFSENLLIYDLLAAARFALLPQDDLNLASLLKSPIFSFSEQDLLEICLVKNEKSISLFDALSLENKGAFKVLEDLILAAKKIDCYEFFAQLLSDELREKIAVEFGEAAFSVLDQFMLKIADFCSSNLPNLQKFIDYIDKTDLEISVIDDDLNCVFVSTIHSAKGLQAPILILPDCCFNFNKMRATKENLLWLEFDDKFYEKVEFPIWLVRKNYANAAVLDYKNKRIKELKDEYWRLFYVALTRAENEIYISGFGNDNDADSWYSKAVEVFDGYY